MNLQETHSHLGKLLESGLPPDLPVVSLVNGEPCELLQESIPLSGAYKADPAPKMSAFRSASGPMVVLTPITEDASDLLNRGTHREIECLIADAQHGSQERERLTPAEHQSPLPRHLREMSVNASIQMSSSDRQILLAAASEIEGGEESYAALIEQCRLLKSKLASTEHNLAAAYDVIASANRNK